MLHRFILRFILTLVMLAGLLTASPAQRPAVHAQNAPQKYLIVSPDEFADVLADFISVQQERGFQVQLALLSQTGTAKEQIKSFIQRTFPRPKYVLLVGDDEHIPAWPFTTSASPSARTDLYYTTFDSGYRPDTILGRLPVHNETDLVNYLAKLTAYYRMKEVPPWEQQISFIASDHGSIASDTEGQFEDIISAHTTPTGYSGTFTGHGGAIAPIAGGDRLFPVTYKAVHSDVISAINRGSAAIVYIGPGKMTTWDWNAGPFLTVGDVQAFDGPPIPLVLALAPDTADFAAPVSMADAWMLNAQSGALTYVGASAGTINITDRELAHGFFNTEFSDFSTPLSVGESLKTALYILDEFFYPGTGAKTEYESYQLFGDPSLTFRRPQGARLTTPKTYLPAGWGVDFTFPVSVMNPGETTEAFDLTIQSSAEQVVSLNTYFLPSLSPGESQVVVATILLSTDYEVGTSDHVTITAIQGSNELIKTQIIVTLQTFDPSISFPLLKRIPGTKTLRHLAAAVGIIQ